MFILCMLKEGLISCWNEKQIAKGYLSANEHSGLDLTAFPSTLTYLVQTVGCSVCMKQKDIWSSKKIVCNKAKR